MIHKKDAYLTSIAVTMVVLVGCGQDGEDRFKVVGKVLDAEGSGIAEVSVSCLGANGITTTGTDGGFTISCPVPIAEDENEYIPPSTLWFAADGMAPAARSLTSIPGGTLAMLVVMSHESVTEQVDIPTGNTSIPVLTDTMTISFERDSMLSPEGAPIAGTLEYRASSWDNSLPVEFDEAAGSMMQDALFPPWAFVPQSNDDSGWMRPMAAGWFDPSPAGINPSIGVDVQMFSQFADEVLGRPLSGAPDATVYLLEPGLPAPEKLDQFSLTSGNQVSASVDRAGLYVWMAPQESHACFNVQVMKGDVAVEGAQVTAWEQFGGELQKFLDEKIGSTDGSFCLRATSGKMVRIDATIVTRNGLANEVRQILSGGNASCGEGCTPVTISFPCEIKADCAAESECVDGNCVAPETT